MFNLHFISVESGLVWYWHNGYCHYLDSRNNLVKFPCTKEQFEVWHPICTTEPETIQLCRAVGAATFYEDVFIGSEATGPDKDTFMLVDEEGDTVGRVEIPILSLDDAEIYISSLRT